LEKRRGEQVLPEGREVARRGEGEGWQEGEMAQTMYTHMNKCINNKKKKKLNKQKRDGPM
jgi:hypothetical protein